MNPSAKIKNGDELLLMNILPINLRGLRVVVEGIEHDRFGKVFDVKLLEEPPGRCAFHLGDVTTVYGHQLQLPSGACLRFQPGDAVHPRRCLMCLQPQEEHNKA